MASRSSEATPKDTSMNHDLVSLALNEAHDRIRTTDKPLSKGEISEIVCTLIEKCQGRLIEPCMKELEEFYACIAKTSADNVASLGGRLCGVLALLLTNGGRALGADTKMTDAERFFSQQDFKSNCRKIERAHMNGLTPLELASSVILSGQLSAHKLASGCGLTDALEKAPEMKAEVAKHLAFAQKLTVLQPCIHRVVAKYNVPDTPALPYCAGWKTLEAAALCDSLLKETLDGVACKGLLGSLRAVLESFGCPADQIDYVECDVSNFLQPWLAPLRECQAKLLTAAVLPARLCLVGWRVALKVTRVKVEAEEAGASVLLDYMAPAALVSTCTQLLTTCPDYVFTREITSCYVEHESLYPMAVHYRHIGYRAYGAAYDALDKASASAGMLAVLEEHKETLEVLGCAAGALSPALAASEVFESACQMQDLFEVNKQTDKMVCERAELDAKLQWKKEVHAKVEAMLLKDAQGDREHWNSRKVKALERLPPVIEALVSQLQDLMPKLPTDQVEEVQATWTFLFASRPEMPEEVKRVENFINEATSPAADRQESFAAKWSKTMEVWMETMHAQLEALVTKLRAQIGKIEDHAQAKLPAEGRRRKLEDEPDVDEGLSDMKAASGAQPARKRVKTVRAG